MRQGFKALPHKESLSSSVSHRVNPIKCELSWRRQKLSYFTACYHVILNSSFYLMLVTSVWISGSQHMTIHIHVFDPLTHWLWNIGLKHLLLKIEVTLSNRLFRGWNLLYRIGPKVIPRLQQNFCKIGLKIEWDWNGIRKFCLTLIILPNLPKFLKEGQMPFTKLTI